MSPTLIYKVVERPTVFHLVAHKLTVLHWGQYCQLAVEPCHDKLCEDASVNWN